jgi:hypothetical protein
MEGDDEWTADELSTAALVASSVLAQHGVPSVRPAACADLQLFVMLLVSEGMAGKQAGLDI